MLLVAHLDVVEALREDWSFDPFKLIEKDGYYYGRGSGDDKFMAATFVATLIRYKQEGFRPDRDIILALETDEEILDRNGVGMQWLIKNHRDLIDAEFALNEGGGVGSKDGKAIRNNVQTSEKVPVDYTFTVRNPGGHSSVPSKNNAIYHLAGGLSRLAQFDFPVKLNPVRRLREPGPRCRSAAVRLAGVQCADSHHVCRDAAGSGRRRQRLAAKSAGHHQLPRPAGRIHRRS
jgi:acetylornithine deacetylase/succinyl-diaminopimelate desuccinylase-like protein